MARVLAFLLGLMLLPGLAPAQATGISPWDDFKARFLADDGRVIDTGNDNVSHSEGQGYAMLLAVIAGDRPAFDRLWTWTQANLRRKNDALFVWRYKAGAADPVADKNNATDGDIFIAWALLRAAELWREPAFAAAAAEIRAAVRDKLTVEQGGRLLLLPGVEGFRRPAGTEGAAADYVVNLSYLVLPAFRAFAAAAPGEGWDRLAADSLALLRDARFGRYGLPPDWLLVTADGRLAPAGGWPPRFGFDALRVPLYLAWGRAGADQFDALHRYFAAFAAGLPAWVDLSTGAVADFAGRRSLYAIAGLVLGARNPLLEVPRPDDDYYTAIVALLAGAAWTDLQAP
ncbi:glycosyl hydrolase family 8 [Zavarzinia compransoris]|uniref:Glucanase n=1 Tax=Zavarzinia compransoris TaxID=1264899 RepID=A0A317E0I9_9PROT|nr:glycosyl hydrolase family 8 [Zavarzinia compransoris]PWR20489.1 endoglucanase [Zavarzinia compransoris]TDP43865.1 endoglucanase [Zavarzinia compransoris]